MLSGTHRNSLQEQVIYGWPALEALTDLSKAFGAHRLMITSTASLAGPGGLAQRLAKNYGAACIGIFAGVSAHSPREGVIAGAAEARRLGADLLVAVGGGSVIDATKVMQLALWGGVESVEGLGAYRVGPGRIGRMSRSLPPAFAWSPSLPPSRPPSSPPLPASPISPGTSRRATAIRCLPRALWRRPAPVQMQCQIDVRPQRRQLGAARPQTRGPRA
jgi:maleylacetate reductase